MKPRYKVFTGETTILNTNWKFIEKYYPNYYGSDKITLHEDLHKILHEEDEENSKARKLLHVWYDGNRRSLNLIEDYNNLTNEINVTAINNFMETKT